MSKILDHKINELQQRVTAMAGSVQQLLGASVAALMNSDAEEARSVCHRDQAINDERYSLERDAVAVIAMQQPMARDLRLLVGILEIATELERMGDYAKDISRITLRQTANASPQPPAKILEMAHHTIDMLGQAVIAFVASDAEQATQIAHQDSAIDELCAALHKELLERAYADESELNEAIRLLTAVHNIERFADRVTNICERIIYIESGEQLEFDT